MPYLQDGFSDATPEGVRELCVDFFNRGVGPAHEQSLRAKVDGIYVNSLDEMIRVSLGTGTAAKADPVLETL